MKSPLWCSLTRLTPTTSNKGCRKYSPPRPHQQRKVAALTSPCVGNHLHNRLKQLEIFIFNDLSSWFKSIFSNSNLISSFTQTLVIHLQNIVKFKIIVKNEVLKFKEPISDEGYGTFNACSWRGLFIERIFFVVSVKCRRSIPICFSIKKSLFSNK